MTSIRVRRHLTLLGVFKMENQTLVVLDGNQVTVESLRIEVAEAVKRAYGAERAYAKGLNQIFAFDWFVFEANDDIGRR
jgi:hypothetical protein